jgi:hypothetical protein
LSIRILLTENLGCGYFAISQPYFSTRNIIASEEKDGCCLHYIDINQHNRLLKLNEVAISQMKILVDHKKIKVIQ